MKKEGFAKKPVTGILLCLLMSGMQVPVSAEIDSQTESVEYKTTTATSVKTPVVVTDADMREQLSYIIDSRKELMDDVTFDVRGGVITLKGTVDNNSERELALRLAKDIVGIVRVENLLRSEK